MGELLSKDGGRGAARFRQSEDLFFDLTEEVKMKETMFLHSEWFENPINQGFQSEYGPHAAIGACRILAGGRQYLSIGLDATPGRFPV